MPMPEGEIRKPIPVPLPGDYSVAAEILDSQFKEEGSAWTAYYKAATIEIWNKHTVRETLEAQSSVAVLMEPIGNETQEVLDRTYQATHSFRAGMWTGRQLLEVVYNGAVDYQSAHLVLCKSLPFPAYTGQHQYEANTDHLTNIGEEGMDLVGYEAREYIDQWGRDVVSNETMRRYYSLGAGAVLFAGYGMYLTAYDNLRYGYMAAQAFDEVELDQFLQASDPSDN